MHGIKHIMGAPVIFWDPNANPPLKPRKLSQQLGKEFCSTETAIIKLIISNKTTIVWRNESGRSRHKYPNYIHTINPNRVFGQINSIRKLIKKQDVMRENDIFQQQVIITGSKKIILQITRSEIQLISPGEIIIQKSSLTD